MNIDIKFIVKAIPELNNTNNISFEQLTGGLTNTTYKIDADCKSYVLRINGSQSDYLNLSRETESEVMLKTAELDISPKVIITENKSDYLITEFIDGRSLNIVETHNPNMIKKIASKLKEIHSIENIKRECSPFHLIRQYLNAAKKFNIVFPENIEKYLYEMRKIELNRSKDSIYTKKYCHNDYHTGHNLLLKDEKIYVIDWELSGIGDVFFDLATISSDNSYSIKEDIILLKSYFGEFCNDHLLTLNDMKFVCMLRELSWALLHDGLSQKEINNNFNYRQFANYIVNRLENKIYTLND